MILYKAYYIKTIFPLVDMVTLEEKCTASPKRLYLKTSIDEKYTSDPAPYIDENIFMSHLKEQDEKFRNRQNKVDTNFY